MFKAVETQEEWQTVQSLHQTIFSESSFIVEEMHPDAEQFLFYEDHHPVGMIEFVRYQPEVFTTVENDFAFSAVEDVRENQSTTWEVDKLGILPAYRSKGFVEEVVKCMRDFALSQGATHYIALLESSLYKMLRIAYPQFVITKLGDAFVAEGEKKKIVPVVIDIKASLKAEKERSRV